MSEDAIAAQSACCPSCGKSPTASQRFCFCGYDTATPRVSTPTAGVGGWLLYFCAQLILLNPIVIGWQVLTEYRKLSGRDDLGTSIGSVIAIDSAVRITLLASGFAVAALLVVRNRHALTLVRAYLLGFAGVYFALASLPYICGVPLNVRDRIAGVLLYRAVMTVPATTFWLLYFKHSKRVKLTYGTGPVK